MRPGLCVPAESGAIKDTARWRPAARPAHRYGPSRSASAKARSTSARSAKKRLGCQPTPPLAMPRPLWSPLAARHGGGSAQSSLAGLGGGPSAGWTGAAVPLRSQPCGARICPAEEGGVGPGAGSTRTCRPRGDPRPRRFNHAVRPGAEPTRARSQGWASGIKLVSLGPKRWKTDARNSLQGRAGILDRKQNAGAVAACPNPDGCVWFGVRRGVSLRPDSRWHGSIGSYLR
jgi:hypothetical protein